VHAGRNAHVRFGGDGQAVGARVDGAVHSIVQVAARAHGRRRDRAAVVEERHIRGGRDADGCDGGVAPVGGARVDCAVHSNVQFAARAHRRRRDRGNVVNELNVPWRF